MIKLSIVIPAYNEEKRIGRTLESYGKFFGKLKKSKKLDFEIIIAINNTKDNTEGVVKLYQRKCKEITYLNLASRGKGLAIIAGFKDALKRKNDLIGFVDADLATSPEAFYELVENMNGYDGVIASRYVKGSIVRPKQTFLRILASRVFNLIVRSLFMFPYRDTQCGAKLIKRKAIEKVIGKMGVTEWAFDVDLLYNLHKSGFRVKEQRTTWSDMKGSKIDMKKSSTQMFLAAARLRLVNSPFKIFAKQLKWLVKPVWKIVK
jgi:glycosyltransferase involved in cell wall biosynthesis